MKRIASAILLFLAILTGGVVIQPGAAFAADPNNCYDWQPPNVRITHCWKVVYTMTTGRGHNFACVVLDENPSGEYAEITTYGGWSFLDANGRMYTDSDGNGNPVPWAITTVLKEFRCGRQ